MRSIDVHAHLTPQCFWRATENGGNWHTLTPREGRERPGDRRSSAASGRCCRRAPSGRPRSGSADMDSLGVDVHVVSPYVGFYNYQLDAKLATATARATNDEIASMTRAWPTRFAGLGTLPDAGREGVDRRARALHDPARPQGRRRSTTTSTGARSRSRSSARSGRRRSSSARSSSSIRPARRSVTQRTKRYHLPNSIGNLVDRAVTFATLVSRRRHGRSAPTSRSCSATAGATPATGSAGWTTAGRSASEARVNISQPPSAYLRRFYYDCIVYTEPAAALPDRHGGRRPRGLRHGLALRHGARLAGRRGSSPWRASRQAREGGDPLARTWSGCWASDEDSAAPLRAYHLPDLADEPRRRPAPASCACDRRR